jgi:nitroreductase
MDFFTLIQKRHSIRRFKEDRISDHDLRKILESAVSAPSAGNLQSYEIYVVHDKDKKLALSKVSWDKDSLLNAPVCLVFCAHPERSSKYGERGEKLYCIQDATIACSYAQLAATELGYGCVWIGAFEDDDVRKILEIDEKLVPIALLPIGIPDEEPIIKPRRDFSEIIHEI